LKKDSGKRRGVKFDAGAQKLLYDERVGQLNDIGAR
jgi:hypothetical protein